MKKPMVGYQIYSARDEASQDLLGVLKRVAALGYDGVEFGGFYGHSAAAVKDMLNETGLTGISSHAALPDTTAGILETVAYHAEIGCKYMAIPFLDEAHRPGSAGFAKTIASIYQYARVAKEAGIQMLYHNHDFEFITVCGLYGLDFIYDAIPECLLKTEIDVCWVNYAGVQPVEYIRKYAGRCPIVHLKDYVGSKDGGQPYALINADGSDDGKNNSVAFEFRPVGHGIQNMPPIVEAAIESGAEWLIVEQDMSVGRAPLEAAEMSRAYLKSIGV